MILSIYGLSYDVEEWRRFPCWTFVVGLQLSSSLKTATSDISAPQSLPVSRNLVSRSFPGSPRTLTDSVSRVKGEGRVGKSGKACWERAVGLALFTAVKTSLETPAL